MTYNVSVVIEGVTNYVSGSALQGGPGGAPPVIQLNSVQSNAYTFTDQSVATAVAFLIAGTVVPAS
jgi:hypothetical protein